MREFVLKRNDMKKFLIIGNANAVKYKDVFLHIANGEVFIRTKDGVTNFAMHFKTPDGEKTASALWYTNLDSRHLYKELNLTKEYSPEEYPKYDNYDAIEVGNIKNMPVDYDGVMGVPITVLLYDLEGYEIIGHVEKLFINGKNKFTRILIRRKECLKK